MTRRRADKSRRAPPGLSAKSVVVAEAGRIEALGGLVEEFMSWVFEQEPGDYLVTDETHLLDFVPIDEPDASGAWSKIHDLYGLVGEDAPSGMLIDVLEEIAQRRKPQ